MERLWSFRRSGFGKYDFRQLIDTRIKEEPNHESTTQIICDIDKTYLETSFETTVQMIRIAFEDAEDKVTVAGASPFLIAARWGNPYQTLAASNKEFPRPLHFVSASPPQMRKTLEEKISLDGLDWTSDSFKNQAYNIRKGRLGYLRHHVAYKSATLLSIISESKAGTQFILIGDNAEFDAYIYLGLAFFLHKRLSKEQYIRYLLAGGVQDEIAQDFESLLSDDLRAKVKGIFIRRAPQYEMAEHEPISSLIYQFDHYFEILCLLVHWRLVDAQILEPISRAFHNQYHFPIGTIKACLRQLKNSQNLDDSELKIVAKASEQLGPSNSFQAQPGKELIEEFSLDKFPLEGESLLKEAENWSQRLSKE